MKKINYKDLLIPVAILVIMGIVLFADSQKFGGATPSTPFNSSSTVSNTASLALDENLARQKVRFVNDGAVDVYISEKSTSTGVVARTGILLKANGGSLEVEPDQNGVLYKGKYWGITSSGTSTLTVNEE